MARLGGGTGGVGTAARQPAGPDGAPEPSGPVSEGSAAAAFARLALVIGAGVALAIVLHAVNVLVVVLAIVAMIMLHELGHFVAAKASGMKVTEYFLGFGPRLWSVRKGETEYGMKALPAGGYVRIPGMTMLEEVDPADETRSYRQASFPRRLAVAVAGSTVHMLIAIVLCWSLFVFVGASVGTRPYVAGLLRFSSGQTPARKAGLRSGDQFVSIDGKSVTSMTMLERAIESNAGKRVTAVVERHGHLVHVVLHPVDGRHVTEIAGDERVSYHGSRPHGVIGVELGEGAYRKIGPIQAIGRGGAEFGSLVVDAFTGITQVFSLHGLSTFAHTVATAGSGSSSGGAAGHGSSSGSSSTAQPISIVGVIEIGSQAATNDLPYLLLLLAEVNIFIGFVNLFPMLPFDGGHVAIAVYERLRSRKGRRYHADVMKLMPVAYVVLGFVVLLGLGALYANIVHPVHLPGG